MHNLIFCLISFITLIAVCFIISRSNLVENFDNDEAVASIASLYNSEEATFSNLDVLQEAKIAKLNADNALFGNVGGMKLKNIDLVAILKDLQQNTQRKTKTEMVLVNLGFAGKTRLPKQVPIPIPDSLKL